MQRGVKVTDPSVMEPPERQFPLHGMGHRPHLWVLQDDKQSRSYIDRAQSVGFGRRTAGSQN